MRFNYGRLRIVSPPWYRKGRQHVVVRCRCGREFPVLVNSLKTGNTTSCGCKRKQSLERRNYRHGLAARKDRHVLYRTWADIVQRCTNLNHPKWNDYGGRGIAVCRKWRSSFVAFLSDVGDRPFPKAEVDRIDNNRGYEPGNIRWATRSEQTRNTRRNRVLELGSRSMVLTDWAAELGWSYMGLLCRVRRMPLADALIPNPRIRSANEVTVP